MANYYPVQANTQKLGSLESPSTLSASYNDNTTTFETGGMEQVELSITYTVNAGSGGNRKLTMQIESGYTADDLYVKQFSDLDTVSEQITKYNAIEVWEGMVVGTTYKLSTLVPASNKFMRLSFKEDGSANFGTVTLFVTASGM